MKTFIKGLACVTAIAALPTVGSALTLTDSGFTGERTLTNGVQGGTDPDQNEASFQFAWDGSPYTGYVSFSADRMFDLYFENYIPDRATNSQVSGFIFRGPEGQEIQLGENYSATACDGAAFADVFGTGGCNFITGENGKRDVIKPDAKEPILAGLKPGDYTIGIYESQNPNEGSADFRAAAVVPVPAGGLLLIGALGGAAALRRKKKQAA